MQGYLGTLSQAKGVVPVIGPSMSRDVTGHGHVSRDSHGTLGAVSPFSHAALLRAVVIRSHCSHERIDSISLITSGDTCNAEWRSRTAALTACRSSRAQMPVDKLLYFYAVKASGASFTVFRLQSIASSAAPRDTLSGRGSGAPRPDTLTPLHPRSRHAHHAARRHSFKTSSASVTE